MNDEEVGFATKTIVRVRIEAITATLTNDESASFISTRQKAGGREARETNTRPSRIISVTFTVMTKVTMSLSNVEAVTELSIGTTHEPQVLSRGNSHHDVGTHPLQKTDIESLGDDMRRFERVKIGKL